MGKKIKAIGCDVINVTKIEKMIAQYDQEVLSYLFTAKEYELCQKQMVPTIGFAICFAGKEAVSKALGKSVRHGRWSDIEIIPLAYGKGKINLYCAIAQYAKKKKFIFDYLSWDFFNNHVFVTINVYDTK